jgi:hypothetical protein
MHPMMFGCNDARIAKLMDCEESLVAEQRKQLVEAGHKSVCVDNIFEVFSTEYLQKLGIKAAA